MALQAVYTQFLAAPNPSQLASDASLHYITSTTSFRGPAEIVKHLNTLRNQIKKKKEDVLNAIEGRNAIAAEVEMAFEFVSSGGPYLPGLDDNFLADRTVSLPMVHMVSFDSQGKITAIRQSWDQGSLLKQLDVIGKTGRNWPIRDSKDQLRLIASSLQATGVDAARPAERPSQHTRTNTNNATRDPHASLALFASREEVEAQVEPVVSPYAGVRPRQRTFTEILGDEPVDEPGSPSNGRERAMSPNQAIRPKAGTSKSFQPIRLFEGQEGTGAEESTEKESSPDRFYRPNPKKYEHFEFADSPDAQDAPRPAPPKQTKSKNGTNWSFDDFTTPAKGVPTRGLHRAQDVRHWSNDNDDQVAETPVKKQTQVKGRRDAEAHFEMVDDGLPSGEPRLGGRPRGTAQNSGLGLYENNLYKDDGSKPTPGPARALGNITNLEDRRKDFAPHFEMTDDSPAYGNGSGKPQTKQDDFGKGANDHKKAVKMMESNWDTYDVSPSAQKENSNPNPNPNAGSSRNGAKAGPKETGITIAGDGMGGRKGAARNYLTGGEQAIGTAGDGMGGKKGSGRAWAIGDESDEEVQAVRPKAGKQQQAASSFWDF